MVFNWAAIGENWWILSISELQWHVCLIQLSLLCCGLNSTAKQGTYRYIRHILIFRFVQVLCLAPKKRCSPDTSDGILSEKRIQGLNPQEILASGEVNPKPMISNGCLFQTYYVTIILDVCHMNNELLKRVIADTLTLIDKTNQNLCKLCLL